MKEKVFVIGITGGSGSGKTTLAKNLVEKLGADQCVVLSQDHYYKDQSDRFDKDGGAVNFDHPEAIDFELKAMHVQSLKRGESVEVPVYDFKSHSRLEKTLTYYPKPYLMIDGTLILSQPPILELLDLAVFLDVEEDIRFERRLKRDVVERGRTEEGVRNQFYKQVKPMHDLYIEPNKTKAHHILRSIEEVQKFLQLCTEFIRKPQ